MRGGRAGPVGVGPRETGVDRTPPRRGHAPVETPTGSTVAVERWTGPKRDGRLPARPDSGPARTERPRPLREACTTGAAQRALAVEPGCFRYAYRSGHAARRCDVTRSLENHMKTIPSLAQTREGAACSLRTSRLQPFTARICVCVIQTGNHLSGTQCVNRENVHRGKLPSQANAVGANLMATVSSVRSKSPEPGRINPQ